MKKKILIMDDELTLCEEAAGFFSDQGYDAYYALDGVKGLEAIEKKHPDLLLLDIRMPNMDGLQVLDELAVRFPHLRVVIISGHLDAEITAKVIEHGAAVCVDKPFRLEELLERVVRPLIDDPV